MFIFLHQELDWRRWAKNQPANFKGQEDCAYLTWKFNETKNFDKLRSLNCNFKLYPVCTPNKKSQVKRKNQKTKVLKKVCPPKYRLKRKYLMIFDKCYANRFVLT